MTEELKADFVRVMPGGVLDDTTFEQIESALDRLGVRGTDFKGKWLTLAERIATIPVAGPEWMHLKRGTTYTEVGRGYLQVATKSPVEDDVIVAYRGADGKLNFREEEEFMDGRFTRLTPNTMINYEHRILVANALAAIQSLDDWTNYNETAFSGWGDMTVPDGATWMRVKSGQALSAVKEVKTFLTNEFCG